MGKRRPPSSEQEASDASPPIAFQPVPLTYRIPDAAAALGISATKVWDLIREGRLPARRLDGSVVIRREDLVAFVDALPLVRQLAEPTALPPELPPPVPRPTPPPAAKPIASRPMPPPPTPSPATPPHARPEPMRPSFARSPPTAPPAADPKAPYGRGRTGKPLPPPNPNGWGARTLRRPSEQLAAIVGPDPISRPKALERIWKHIHAGGLQRPGDMRIIFADEKLRAVAGTEVITMYALEEMIRPHLGVIT